MRLTGGEGKGRKLLDAPRHVRPTSGRVREQLFFMLRDRLAGAHVLDLFAGTGSLGLEALARGAARATFVESDREALRVIRANLDLCKLTARGHVLAGDVYRHLRRPIQLGGPFDLVFADPPYSDRALHALLDVLRESRLIEPGGLFLYESCKHEDWPEDPESWTLVDNRRAGGTRLFFCTPREVMKDA